MSDAVACRIERRKPACCEQPRQERVADERYTPSTAPKNQEGVLHEVVDLIPRVGDSPCIPIDARPVLAHELVERALIAGPQLLDQAAVIVLIRRVLHTYTMSRIAVL